MEYSQPVARCPSCGSERVRRIRVAWIARMAKRLTARRPYICDNCGWHGWLAPVLAPRVFVQLPPQPPVSTKVDPLSSTVGEQPQPCDFLELFESEHPSCQEGVSEPQSEPLRHAVPIEATPPVGSPTAPWRPRVLHAVRLFRRVAHEQFVRGVRRSRLRRLEVPRSKVLRSSGLFALGVVAGALAVWYPSESAMEAPSEMPSTMAVRSTTGTRLEASPFPSRESHRVASIGQIPSVAPRVQSARAPGRDRQGTAVEFGRPASSRPDSRSTARTRPAAQSTQVRATAAGTLARARGSIAIDSHPPGARVSVDGRRVGSTPLVLKDVPAGTRLVRVEADGYQVWAWTARVVANQRSRVSVKLTSSGTR
jgi:predicted RNA-binding Zn-ribbon protein involved in translation (DUF1610 family)